MAQEDRIRVEKPFVILTLGAGMPSVDDYCTTLREARGRAQQRALNGVQSYIAKIVFEVKPDAKVSEVEE